MEENEEFKTENELSSQLTGLNKGKRYMNKKVLIIIGVVAILIISIIIIIKTCSRCILQRVACRSGYSYG